MNDHGLPHISVIVATCNRPDDLERSLPTLARVAYPSWDVLMVDQSDAEDSASVAARFAPLLPGFRYSRMSDRGLSRAWNAAVAATTGDIIAFFDDDCTVSPDWLRRIADVFTRHPEIDLSFGSVHAAAHDSSSHFIPAFVPTRERIVQGDLSFIRTGGMGASMALRRSLLAAIGGFDAHLGAGAHHFKGGLDTDLSNRALIAGHRVLLTPKMAVEHFGVRQVADGAAARLYRDYAYACGAVDMKVLRCGHWSGLLLMAGHTLYCATRLNPISLMRRRSMNGHEWIMHYVRGLLHAAVVPLDRSRMLYGAPDSQRTTLLSVANEVVS